MRNLPERYLQALQEHFAKAPIWFSGQSDSNFSRSTFAPPTTNQDGRNTAFQRWFNFKEAFAPAFVSAAIESLGYQPDHIVDPFGGSGTTAITAQLLSLNATTVEVNPLMADVIASKVSYLSAEELRCAAAQFQADLIATPSNLDRLSHLPPTFVEAPGKERWIFPEAVAKRLTQYLTCIEKISDSTVQRFFKVALGAVLIDVSNVYINGKGRRYRKSWQDNQASAQRLDQLFGCQFNSAFEDVLRFEHRPQADICVMQGDSRVALKKIERPADLIVFSPPYPNSFDYTDIYNVELWVLGYLKSSDENGRLRKNTLRSHVQIARPHIPPEHPSKKLKATLKSLQQVKAELWDQSIPDMVGGYFGDMESILTESHRLLTERGKVIMVVGDSRYAGVKIEVAVILEELAKAIGFSKTAIKEVRQMRASAQQGGDFHLAESIVELSL